MKLYKNDWYISIDVTIEWDEENLRRFKQRWFLDRGYWNVDPIRSIIRIPKKIQQLQHMSWTWQCHEEDHLWESNPFTDDVNEWLMRNWWAYDSCMSTSRPHYEINDHLENICLSYRTKWGDHLEWRMKISWELWLKISATCTYIWWRVYYEVKDWKIISHQDVSWEPPFEFIAEWELPRNNNVIVRTMTQEMYDREHWLDQQTIYFITEW